MCEAHISGAIRRAIPGAKKVSASHTRGEACFLTEEAAEESRARELESLRREEEALRAERESREAEERMRRTSARSLSCLR